MLICVAGQCIDVVFRVFDQETRIHQCSFQLLPSTSSSTRVVESSGFMVDVGSMIAVPRVSANLLVGVSHIMYHISCNCFDCGLRMSSCSTTTLMMIRF